MENAIGARPNIFKFPTSSFFAWVDNMNLLQVARKIVTFPAFFALLPPLSCRLFLLLSEIYSTELGPSSYDDLL